MDRESRNGASSSRVVKKKKEWTPMFPVPSHLVESYGGVLPSKVTFRTDESEKKWKLKVEKFNDRYFFTAGWEEFEKEVDIESRGFLMYTAASSEQKGKSKEKRQKISGIGNAHGTTDSSLNENTGSLVEKRLSFRKKMKKHHQYRMGIPTFFANYTGILDRDEIKLRNSEGREWPVLVTHRKSRKSGIFSLCRGFFNFLKDNNMVVGSTLLFLSSSTDTIDVQIVKEGTNNEALFKYLKTKDSSSGAVKRLSFHKEMKKHHQYCMDFPYNFIMTTGKLERGLIKLKNSEGKEWPVSVTNRAKRFSICGGLFDFLKGNNVVIGSILSFSSSSNDTIEVQIVKEGTDKQALFKYLKRIRILDASGHEEVPTCSDLNEGSGSDEYSSSSEEEMDSVSEE